MQKREARPNADSCGGEEAEQFLDRASAYLALQVPVLARLDSIVQLLFSAGLIADVLPRLWERDPQEGLTRQAELSLLTHGALAEVRKLLAELCLTELAKGDQGDRSFEKEP